MELSVRLTKISDLFEKGRCMADIGTDHAYLPIELLKRGICERAFAMDVKDGPLMRAQANVQSAGLSDAVVLRKSDGFAALLPGEADMAAVCGMGGLLMIRLLTEGIETVKAFSQLVLSPQSEIYLVRAFLQKQGFVIDREDMIFEDGKYYQAMHVIPAEGGICEDGCTDQKQQDAIFRYGAHLIREKHPVLLDFLKHEKEKNLRIRANLEASGSGKAESRLKEIDYELELIELVEKGAW